MSWSRNKPEVPFSTAGLMIKQASPQHSVERYHIPYTEQHTHTEVS